MRKALDILAEAGISVPAMYVAPDMFSTLSQEVWPGPEKAGDGLIIRHTHILKDPHG